MSTDYFSPRTGSVLLKQESAFGSIVSDGLVPPTTVFDSGTISTPFEMASVIALEPLTIARDEMRATRGQTQPDIGGVYSSGSKVAVRRGEATLTYRFETVDGGTSDDHPFHILLESMMADGGEPGTTTDAVQTYHDPAPGSTAANAFYFYPTDASLYEEGMVVTVDVDGRPYALYVTEVDESVGDEYIGVEGAPRHLTNGDTIRFTRQFENKPAGVSFAMRFDKPGYRAECFGCRVVGISATLEPLAESAVLRFDFTISIGHLRYAHASWAVTPPVYTGGREVQIHGSTVTISDPLPAPGTTAPYQNDLVADIFVGQMGIGLTAVQQQVPDHRSVVGGELAIADIEVSNTIRLSRPQTGFDTDMVDGDQRLVLICLGSPGAGNALAIVMPCAFSTADPAGRTEEGDNLVQTLTLSAEPPRGTVTAASSDSSIIIATVH